MMKKKSFLRLTPALLPSPLLEVGHQLSRVVLQDLVNGVRIST
jgi:hypothetical protein